jgi:hypothetical protein
MMAPESAGAEAEEGEEEIPDFGGRAVARAGHGCKSALAAADADARNALLDRVLPVDPATKVGYGYDVAESVWCESTPCSQDPALRTPWWQGE